MSPRIRGYVDRVQIDVPLLIAHLDAKGFCLVTDVGGNPIVIVDLAASRDDVTISIAVGFDAPSMVVSGPWLTGRRNEGVIADILSVANDAILEGRMKTALEVIAQALTRKDKSVTTGSVIRPRVVSARHGRAGGSTCASTRVRRKGRAASGCARWSHARSDESEARHHAVPL